MEPFMVLHGDVALQANKMLRDYVAFENLKQGIDPNNKPLAVFKCDHDKQLIGGVYGLVHAGWLALDLLWVEKLYRRQGIGSELLVRIEAEAMDMGAHSAYLWTQEFEAPDFYAKYGYQEYGKLEEFLPGHQLIGMKKQLKK